MHSTYCSQLSPWFLFDKCLMLGPGKQLCKDKKCPQVGRGHSCRPGPGKPLFFNTKHILQQREKKHWDFLLNPWKNCTYFWRSKNYKSCSFFLIKNGFLSYFFFFFHYRLEEFGVFFKIKLKSTLSVFLLTIFKFKI